MLSGALGLALSPWDALTMITRAVLSPVAVVGFLSPWGPCRRPGLSADLGLDCPAPSTP